MTRRFVHLSFTFAVVLLLASHAAGNNGTAHKKTDSAKAAKSDTANKNRQSPPVTAEQESAAMKFVEQHHAALVELLVYLKNSKSDHYDRAIRDLYRTHERLEQYRTRDEQRYHLELELWKSQSQIQLLAARLQMGAPSELEDRLRAELNHQFDLRIAILEHERTRTQARIAKLDEQIGKIRDSRSETIERHLRSLTKAVRNAEVKQKPQPAKADSAKKPTVHSPAKNSNAKSSK